MPETGLKVENERSGESVRRLLLRQAADLL